MITLSLLHPLQSVAVQSWTFHNESSIKIGRATNNEVVLYSAVVSRHHVEIKKTGDNTWEVVNLGSNGTYIDGERVDQVPVVDGMIFRLATSGPKILIKIETVNPAELDLGSQATRIPRQPKGAKDTLIS
ncbi:FHA domain protein [Chondrocystis sp. NIES-4102]|nr:FHA domain protein [Chondrocystis sp. NIES-4102]